MIDGPVGLVQADDPEMVAGVNDKVELAACEVVLQRHLRGRADARRGDHARPAGRSTSTRRAGGRRHGAVARHPPAGRDADRCGLQHRPRRGHRRQRHRPGLHHPQRPRDRRHHRGRDPGGPVRLPASRDAAGAGLPGRAPTSRSRTRSSGAGAKVPHLSYVGDATVGEGTNIGAGNITANYDGFRKHRTTIGARVKTGSDCVFVAPVTVGDDAMTGAGSIITDDVPDGALGIARARQSVIEGFTEKAAARRRAGGRRGEGGARVSTSIDRDDSKRLMVFAGRSSQDARRADRIAPRHRARQRAPPDLRQRRDLRALRGERPRRRRLPRAVHVQAGERQPDGAVDHDQRRQAGLGAPHHRRHPVVRLLAPGQEVGAARADHGQARRRAAAGRRRATACSRWTSTPARFRASSRCPWTT